MSIDTSNLSIMDFVPHAMKRVAADEYHGACPMCGGTDRFVVWTASNRWMCRQCTPKGGNLIDLVMRTSGDDFKSALHRLGLAASNKPASASPTPAPASKTAAAAEKDCFALEWQQEAARFCANCHEALWHSDIGASARQYLADRGLDLDLCQSVGLGLNTQPYESNQIKFRAYRGIVIPWHIEGLYWRVNVRRRAEEIAAGGNKYHEVGGGANGLYIPTPNGDVRQSDEVMACVVTESEFDALSIMSMIARAGRRDELSRQLVAVATGGATRARLMRWLAKVATSDLVLIAFDNDPNGAGDKGAEWWLSNLGSKGWRLRPDSPHKDVNDILRAEGDEGLFQWIKGYKR